MLQNSKRIMKNVSASLETKLTLCAGPLKNGQLSNKIRYSFMTQKKNYNNMYKALSYTSAYYFANLPAHTKLTMPALSPTMRKGKILKWNKQVGDRVDPGDVLCEVETDKASVGFEMQESGYVAKILLPEGATDVQVGTLVAILVEDQKLVGQFKDFSEGGAAKAEPAQQKPAEQHGEEEHIKGTKRTNVSIHFGRHGDAEASHAPAQQVKVDFPPHTKLTMPALSPTMQKGTIKKWTKNIGDKLIPGDVIADVETDKATVGFEMQEEGYLAKILVPEGSKDVEVGKIVAIVVEDASKVQAFADYSAEAASRPVQTKAAPAQTIQTGQAQARQARGDGERVIASPAARKVAQELNVDLGQIRGSGPQQRILKHDVEEQSKLLQIKTPHVVQPQSIVQEQASAPDEKLAPKPVPTSEPKTVRPAHQQQAATSNDFEEIPVSNMREVIAQRLLESKLTIPHYYLQMEINMDNLIKFREELNKHSTSKVSFNDLFIKASSLACIDVPEVNSQWHGKFIRKYKNADISVAVDTGSGLITPIVKSANLKGVSKIATEIKGLVEKAKKNALKPEEFIGGTFTISNLGMLGVTNFAAIINPPQSCILSVGKTDRVVIPDPEKADAVKIANILRATLCCDHRVVDGAIGARWIQKFKGYLENPLTMLL